MSSTLEKAAYILETKQEMAQALTDLGQEVSEYDSFRSYVDKIKAIKSKDHALTADHATTADRATEVERIAGVLPVENGGTGVTTLDELATALGIGGEGNDASGVGGEGCIYIVNAKSTDGVNYTATDDRIKEVKVGTAVIFVPQTGSRTTQPTFNLNGEGDFKISLASSPAFKFTSSPNRSDFVAVGCPMILIRSSTGYGEQWVCVSPGSVAYASEAGSGGSGGSGGDASTFGGYSYGQLFGTDSNGAPAAHRAKSLDGHTYVSLFDSSSNPAAHRANALLGVYMGDAVSVNASDVMGIRTQASANATSIQAIWDNIWSLVDRVKALEGN